MKRLLVLVVLATFAVASHASAKGLQLTLQAGDRTPGVGQQVSIALHGTPEYPLPGPCLRMRIVVVAPGVSVKRALRSLEGEKESRRIGRWGAFRLASLRSTGELRWHGVLRPNTPGRWTLVVPNWCAAGYVSPAGVERLHLDVQPAGRRGP